MYSKWPELMLMGVSLVARRDGNGDRSPQPGAGHPQYGLLACVLIGLIGSLAMLVSEK
ncbi:hypothetical protein [Bradyrhizobium sp. URHC0002]